MHTACLECIRHACIRHEARFLIVPGLQMDFPPSRATQKAAQRLVILVIQAAQRPRGSKTVMACGSKTGSTRVRWLASDSSRSWPWPNCLQCCWAVWCCLRHPQSACSCARSRVSAGARGPGSNRPPSSSSALLIRQYALPTLNLIGWTRTLKVAQP